MSWKNYSNLEGSHAFLSPSSYHWTNYDISKLKIVYANWKAAQRGTILHDFARRAIDLGERLFDGGTTLNMYVNDAIDLRMKPEQPLYFSKYCYGTADAISFIGDRLTIHDLKTGITPASLHQLEIYAALFCLDYDIRPGDIDTTLRIYQNNDIIEGRATPEIILPYMDTIQTFSKVLEEIDEEEGVNRNVRLI